MHKIFFGHDERVGAGTTVFVQSAIKHACEPLSFSPITRKSVEGIQEGSNAFTFRRFLVPYIMQWEGLALFVDGSDMLCRADISEVFKLWDYRSAVQVVKRATYDTQHNRKYVGTAMEAYNDDYPRKQWASVMLINCAHFAWRQITPKYVASAKPLHLLQFGFLEDGLIGDLPVEWNWLADEDGENPDAKLCHWTAGVPGMHYYKDSPMAAEWHLALAAAQTVTG